MAKKGLLDLSQLMDNVVSDDINEYSMTLYGTGGSGKSSFANALKRRTGSSASFFFEPRMRGLGGIKAVECSTWDYFLAYIDQLEQFKRKGTKVPFDNIIIDSADSAYEKCTAYVMDENDWETLIGDYGSRYTAVGSEFKNAIERLRNMGFIVTFLTHEKDEEAHDVQGTAYNKSIPIVPNQIQGLIKDQVDFIMYLENPSVQNEDGELIEIRRLWFKNNPYMALKTPLYGMPDYIEWVELDDGVTKFLEAFDKAVKITRAKYDDGEDISNPNEDNDTPIEFAAPKVTSAKESELVDEFDEEDDFEDIEIETVSLEDLQDKAVAIRDSMLESGTAKSAVVKILKEELGTASITKCKDVDLLLGFINNHTTE